MEIDITEITDGDKWVGKNIWICDYRRPDIDKKAIRHVQPTEVLVRSNADLTVKKNIYYTENHFVKLNAKGMPSSTIIGVFDTTGFRSDTGTPLKAFTTKEECIVAYNNMADVIIADLDLKMSKIIKNLMADKNEVINNKK